MAQTLKVIAQSYPAQATLTTAYTVPGATTTALSSIMVCNQLNTDATFRISVAVAGAADTATQYLYFDNTVFANDTFTATVGITLAATDVVRVYSSSGLLSFNLFGTENT